MSDDRPRPHPFCIRGTTAVCGVQSRFELPTGYVFKTLKQTHIANLKYKLDEGFTTVKIKNGYSSFAVEVDLSWVLAISECLVNCPLM